MTHLFVVVLCAVLGNDGTPASGKPEGRRFHEIDQDLQTAFRQDAQAKSPDEKIAAVHQLAALHREIVGDSRYFTSDALKEYRRKVASRLNKVKSELRAKIAREQRDGGKVAEPANSVWADEATAALSSQLLLVGYSTGGPVQFLLSSGGPSGSGSSDLESSSGASAGRGEARGGAAIADWGPDLVNLIERTISPRFWDVNGGPGTIVYYRPLHCLVVRATGEIHGEVGGALGGLRDAGR